MELLESVNTANIVTLFILYLELQTSDWCESSWSSSVISLSYLCKNLIIFGQRHWELHPIYWNQQNLSKLNVHVALSSLVYLIMQSSKSVFLTLRWWTPGQDQELINHHWSVREEATVLAVHLSRCRWIQQCSSSWRHRRSFSKTCPTTWPQCRLKWTRTHLRTRRRGTSTVNSWATSFRSSLTLLIH